MRKTTLVYRSKLSFWETFLVIATLGLLLLPFVLVTWLLAVLFLV
jgi:hypothetical protein